MRVPAPGSLFAAGGAPRPVVISCGGPFVPDNESDRDVGVARPAS
jgi:hypothetical protein